MADDDGYANGYYRYCPRAEFSTYALKNAMMIELNMADKK
jgi:hypothetical protein